MRYAIAVAVGCVTALATAFLWIVFSFVLPVGLPFLLSPIGLDDSGSGAAGAAIGSGSILMAAVLGFAGGVVWRLRRR